MLHVAGSIALLAAVCTAQKGAEAPRPGADVVVSIVCTEDGKRKPRVPDAKSWSSESKLFLLVGHRICWIVEERKFDTPKMLKKGLAAILADEKRTVPDPKRPGYVLPPRVILEPLAKVRWHDVIQTLDVVMDSFPDKCIPELRIGKSDRFGWFIPKSLDLPARLEHTLVVPKAKWCVPDDDPPKGRPVIDVMQDGRILSGTTTIYSPLRDRGGFSVLEKHFTALRARAKKSGLIERRTLEGFKGEAVTVPILIRADKWADWFYVQRVLTLCEDPRFMFWKREIGVTDHDMERRYLERLRESKKR